MERVLNKADGKTYKSRPNPYVIGFDLHCKKVNKTGNIYREEMKAISK